MVKQFARNITSFLIRENIIRDEDVEIYQYGTEQIMINLITFVVIGIVATIIGGWIETIFFLAGMVPIRAAAGGFHASTQQRCNILTLTVYILNVIVIELIMGYMSKIIVIILCGIIILSLFKFAPVDHKNRELVNQDYLNAKNRSKMIGIILSGYCIGVSMLGRPNNVIVISTMMGALTASISLIIGSVKRGGERNEKTDIIP
jgi:accessory gene regulator B